MSLRPTSLRPTSLRKKHEATHWLRGQIAERRHKEKFVHSLGNQRTSRNECPVQGVNSSDTERATATCVKTSPNNSPTVEICRVNIQPKKQTAGGPVDRSERLTRALLMLAGIPIADSAREELARTIAARIADEQ